MTLRAIEGVGDIEVNVADDAVGGVNRRSNGRMDQMDEITLTTIAKTGVALQRRLLMVLLLPNTVAVV
jgi:hypothetical protein